MVKCGLDLTSLCNRGYVLSAEIIGVLHPTSFCPLLTNKTFVIVSSTIVQNCSSETLFLCLFKYSTEMA